MLDSANSSPQSPGTRNSVTIIDANRLRMPHKCVVCDMDVSDLFSYTQDHLPIVGPGVGFVSTTQVWVPYCANHRDRFQSRFRKLRLWQGVAYGVIVVCLVTILFEPFRLRLGWAPQPGPVSWTFVGLLFAFLVMTIFCIKPFLYDVFVTRSGNQIRFKSKYRSFIKNIIEANPTVSV
jgi:hypothetical protein